MTADLVAAVSDGGVWISLAVACFVGLGSLGLGTVIARRTRLLQRGDPYGQTIGVGLSIGLLTIAAGYATLVSRGSSTLSPIFVAILLATAVGRGRPHLGLPDGRAWRLGLSAAVFMIVVGLTYGSTIALSARDGAQPVEFVDEAYYAVLSAELNATGRESVYGPSGFDQLPGLPVQSWYHWGEIWLGAAVLNVPGVTPIQGRHMVVLPLLLLAVACMAGTLVRRLSKRNTTEVFLLGAFGTLSIAPVPLVLEDHFDWWPRALGFGITMYGLAVVVSLLGLFLIVTRRPSEGSWPDALMTGVAAAALVSTHIAIAVVAAAGMVGMIGLHVLRRPSAWRSLGGLSSHARALATAVALTVLTVLWGVATGHAIGGSGGAEGVQPFEPAWQRAMFFGALGGLTLMVAPVIALRLRRQYPELALLTAGAGVATVAGAIAWGSRFYDFNMFHLFYGAIAAILTPVAVAVMVVAIFRARDLGAHRAATIGLALLLGQGALGVGATVQRLYEFGPGHYRPVPTSVLEFIRGLPADAKLAYACQPFEEIVFWGARLISLTAHTGRAVVSMCFQTDIPRTLLGQEPDPTIVGPYFRDAPQRGLYPRYDSQPTSSAVREFLERQDVLYIYADEAHPNTLVDDARLIYQYQDVRILALTDAGP